MDPRLSGQICNFFKVSFVSQFPNETWIHTKKKKKKKQKKQFFLKNTKRKLEKKKKKKKKTANKEVCPKSLGAMLE